MRILLAHDGSAGGEQAVALTGAIPWPSGTTVRIVSVVERTATWVGPPLAPGSYLPAPDIEARIVDYQQEVVDGAVRALQGADRTVEGAVVRGRAATVLVDEAAQFRADLVVVGSRGHGPVASLVLGSVSAEVVDHGPCPVLVARTTAITSVVVASDGSEPSAAAERIVADWRIFEGLPVRVVSVADVVRPWHTGVAPTMVPQVAEAYARDLDEARAEHTRIADDVAGRLRAAGRTVDSSMRSGDAAGEIIAAAEETGADLIVIGSRGRTGLARVVLGSVARNVLHGSRASVLVVRGPVAESE